MPMTFAERLSDVPEQYSKAPCDWCAAVLARGEGKRLEREEHSGYHRFCNKHCAEDFEADRLSRSLKARADARVPGKLEPIGGKPESRVPVEDLSPCEPFPTRAEVAR